MQTIHSIRKGETYMLKLNVLTEEAANEAFKLVCQLNGMLGEGGEQFLIMWTPTGEIVLHKKQHEYFVSELT